MSDVLEIGLVLPDVLGTYGDDGNALVLRQRARMRGITANIHPIYFGEPVPDSLDLYTVGGGEDTAQMIAVEHLSQDGGLSRAVAKGTPVIAICAGLQALGTSFRASGSQVAGLGLIDAETTSLKSRTIGELAGTPLLDGLTQPLTGFENHMGATRLGGDAKPLFKVTRGIGNTDQEDDPYLGCDGAVQGSVIATYMHGPALARNPELADLLLARALGITPGELAPLDLPEVTALRNERLGQRS